MKAKKAARMGAVLGIILLVSIFLLIPVSASSTRSSIRRQGDVMPDQMIFQELPEPDEAKEYDIEVSSDVPVSIYILDSENFTKYCIENTSFENSLYDIENITEFDDSWEIPSDGEYYLVIVNYGEETTNVELSVSYKIERTTFEDIIDDLTIEGFPLLCFCCFMPLGVIILLLVLFFVLIKKE